VGNDGDGHGGRLRGRAGHGASRGSIEVVFLAWWFAGMWTVKLAGMGGAPARRSGDKLHGGELGMAWRASLGMEREKGSAALYRGGEGVQTPGRRKWWPRPLMP
jgi:hypothetical protein